MTAPQYAAMPAGYYNSNVSLINATGTSAKVLLDKLPSVASSLSPPSPAFYGGATMIDLTAVSTDTSARDVIFWMCDILSTVGSATGAVTNTATTIVRTTGSFIVDGFSQGDIAIMFAPTTQGAAAASVSGQMGVVAGDIISITDTTITVNSATFSTTGTVPTGTRICKCAPWMRASTPAGAGTNGSVSSQSLLNHSLDGSLLRYEKKVGSNQLVAVSAAAAITSGKYININAQVARY